MSKQYLIQKFPKKGIGRIFARTEALASRTDMEPYDEAIFGPVPKSMEVRLDGMVPVAAKKPAFKNTLEGTGVYPPETPSLPVAQPAATVPEVPVITKTPDYAPAGSSVPDLDTVPPVIPPQDTEAPCEVGEQLVDLRPKLTPEQKQEKLIKAFKTFTPEDFTGQGLPRIDSCMAALDMADVSSPERDAAWKAFQARK